MMVSEAVPPKLASSVQGYHWTRDTVGESGANVHRLHGKPGAPDLYLKAGAGAVADEIAAEAARLRWLAAHLPVPQVVEFVAQDGNAWLLMSAMPGQPAYRLLERGPGAGSAVVDALAAFLRRLHAIPVAECPFDNALEPRLAQARARIDAGEVDEDDFDEERLGQTAEQVWTDLQAMLPLDFDRVVTHGDFTLDNLLIDGGEVVGCIDVGRAGIADRYQDLALLWNCLGEFGEAQQARLFAQYGIDQPDPQRLAFHLLLDELF